MQLYSPIHHNLLITLLLDSKANCVVVKQKCIDYTETRAGVCKKLCPQLPDSNTA